MQHIGPHGEATPFTPRELAESVIAGPTYEPPYAGALQDEFAWHLVKYLREDLRLQGEAALEVDGPTGPAVYTVDFLLEVPQPDGTVRRVAVECGGARSLRDRERQLRRDANLLASGAVDALYRLRGSDLLHHMEDCLYLMSMWEGNGPTSPFSERGRINLQTLASPEAQTLRLRPEQPSVMVTYVLGPESEEDFPERHLWHAANGLHPFVLLRRFDARFPDVWAPYADVLAPAHRQPAPLRKVG
ncbi:MAG TPA: hypothetical protein VD962_06010 [Rubricoccaceae bacterium]|nr:hypothetical protein [Rubricoccaceae bacterium]